MFICRPYAPIADKIWFTKCVEWETGAHGTHTTSWIVLFLACFLRITDGLHRHTLSPTFSGAEAQRRLNLNNVLIK